MPKTKLISLKEKYIVNLNRLKDIEDLKLRNSEIFNLRKKFFFEYDSLISTISNGPHYLKDTKIRAIVEKEIKRFDGELYDLIAYSIMSNHVHLLIDTSIQLENELPSEMMLESYVQLDQIMKRIKGPTAVYANRYLGRSGQFWARESYDMYIRNEKMFANVISYILDNPVKAGLVANWQDYPGNYLKPHS